MRVNVRKTTIPVYEVSGKLIVTCNAGAKPDVASACGGIYIYA